MIKAIIFDLDGVIVTTDDLHYEAWKITANREGVEFNREINNKLRGVSRKESLDIILESSERKFNSFEKCILMNSKNDIYLDLINNLTENDILVGVKELIQYLKENNYKIAIGSSSKNAIKILKQIKMIEIFDVIVDGNDVINSKPAPDIFLKASKRLNIDPIHCAVIEDSIAGIRAAKAANMLAIAIHDATKYNEAHLQLKNINDLVGYLEKQ